MNVQRSLGWMRPLTLLLLTLAVAVGWVCYFRSPGIQVDFPFLQRDLQPLYAIDRIFDPTQWANISPYTRGFDLFSSPVAGRLAAAILTSIAGIGLVILSLARRWRTSLCLLIAVLSVFCINVSIARILFGHDGLTEPMSRGGLEYYPEVARVNDDPIQFVQVYPRISFSMGIHPGTHPPGGILFLWASGKAVDAAAEWTASARHRIFGPPATQPVTPRNPFGFLLGQRPPPPPQTIGQTVDTATWVAIGFTALAVLPTFWLATMVGGAATARRLLPLYAAAPNLVLYGATSMDGVFLTFAMTALATGIWTMRKRSFLRPVVAGVALWLACFMTFTVALVPAMLGLYAVATMLRRPGRGEAMLARCAFIGVSFIVCQALVQWQFGYDLWATAQAAIERDRRGMGITGHENFEIWWKLSLANLLAWSFGSGVAAIALYLLSLTTGFSRPRTYTFTLATGACVLTTAMSTLFTMETERVWLMLTPLLLIAAAPALRGWIVWISVPTVLLAQAFWIETNYRVYW